MIDIKNFAEIQYGTPLECELTKEYYTKMRKSVFEKICQARNDLPKGWHFKLYEGFRSKKVQKILFDEEFKRVNTCYPAASYEKHFYETTRLVSLVINLDGSLNIPPHNTGGAIDIEIIKDLFIFASRNFMLLRKQNTFIYSLNYNGHRKPLI